jgi:hypothetical protein
MTSDGPGVGDWTILHGGALGDLVLTLQFALRLPGVSRQSRIVVLSRVDPGDLSACRPSIVRHASDGRGLHWLHAPFEPPPDGLRTFFAGRRVVNFCGPVNGVVAQGLELLGADVVLSVDPPARSDDSRHVTERWCSAAEVQGVHCADASVELEIPAQLRAAGRAALLDRGCGPPVVVMHPGSGGLAKCWPATRFADVAGRLRADGCSVMCVVGPAEQERFTPDARARLAESATACWSCPSATELAAVLAGAAAFVGNDSGPTHLAALLGTPTVALFGPTDPVIWGPLGSSVTVLVGADAYGAPQWGLSPATVAGAILATVERGSGRLPTRRRAR